MRYRDIIEAPIDQYSAVGDWDDPKGSFRGSNRGDIETSHKLIHSPVAVKKIRAAWERVPQKFNFWMVNDTKNKQVRSQIYSIEDFRKDPRFEPYAKDINPSVDAINVIYTTNFTNESNYKPMTAWIMAHRLVHVFQMNRLGRSLYVSMESDLANILRDTVEAYGLPRVRGSDMLSLATGYDTGLPILISRMFTMRSARMSKLKNPLDYPAELLAQHLISGRIRFNQLPPSLSIEFRRYGEDIKKVAMLDTKRADQLNARWQELAEDFDQRFKSLLDSLVGKVIVL
jgi:hypothetical protein